MTGGRALEPGGAATEVMTGEEPIGSSSSYGLSPAELELLVAAPPPPPPTGVPKKRPKSRPRSGRGLEIASSRSSGATNDPPPSSSPNSEKSRRTNNSTSSPASSPREMHQTREPEILEASQLYQQQGHQQREAYHPSVQKPHQPVSPLTAKTEELSNSSSPSANTHRNHKDGDDNPTTPLERRRQSHSAQNKSGSLASISTGTFSVDPPTGGDHQGRVSLLATPTYGKADTPGASSQAHYDEIANAAAASRESTEKKTIAGMLGSSPVPNLAQSSPTASSLATEPHSNAHAILGSNKSKSEKKPSQILLPPGAGGEVPMQRQARNELDSVLPVAGNTTMMAPQPKAATVVAKSTTARATGQQQPQMVSSVPPAEEREMPRVHGDPPSVVVVNSGPEPDQDGQKGKKKRGFLGKIFKRGSRSQKKDKGKMSSSNAVSDMEHLQGSKEEEEQGQEHNSEEHHEENFFFGDINAESQEDDPMKATLNQATAPKTSPRDVTDETDFGAFVDDQGFATASPATASPPTSSKNRPEISFLHDDVSTLTGPTFHTESRRKSQDPAESIPNRDHSSNEPMGRYFNFDLDEEAETELKQRPSIDPFEKPFFEPEEMISPASRATRKTAVEPTPTNRSIKSGSDQSKGTKTQAEPSPMSHGTKLGGDTTSPSPIVKSVAESGSGPDLRINTMAVADMEGQLSTDDPMGKQNSSQRYHDPSPRGYATPEATNYPDPIGESPLHKLERGPVGVLDGQADSAPDPPLYLASVPSEDSSDGGDMAAAIDAEANLPEPEVLGVAPSSFKVSNVGTVGAVQSTSSPLNTPSSAPDGGIAFQSSKTRAVPPRVPRSPQVGSTAPPPPPPRPVSEDRAQNKKDGSVETKEETGQAEQLESMFDIYGDSTKKEKTIRSTSRGKPRPEDNIHRKNRAHASSEKLATTERQPENVSKSAEKAPRKSSAAMLQEALLEAAMAKDKPPQDSPSAASASSEHSMYDADTGEKLNLEKATARSAPMRRQARAKSISPREASTSPRKSSEGGNKLMMSSMARMNAKAVAYLHTLNGEPSPRNAWQKPTITMDEEATPASQARARNSFASIATEVPDTPDDSSARFFRAYSGKFKGRKLASKVPTPRSRISPTSKKEVRFTDKNQTSEILANIPMDRNVEISDEVVSMGFAAFRYRREMDIQSGKSQRVVPPRREAKLVEKPTVEEEEPLDPIQRAGRRLLAKAAVPIQTSARRLLAQREAVDRMWALIEIQSYVRRWRAEANLLASSLAAVTIQRVIRGHLGLNHFNQAKAAATDIQRIVRGHLASAWAFDTVYSAIIIQSLARRFLTQLRISNQSFSATLFQTSYRGYVQRSLYLKKRAASTQVQKFWRANDARVRFKYTVIEIIVVQSRVRIWSARRKAMRVRNALENSAASKIQAAWRGFQGYTDYIFYLVDVLLVQRVARRWLAIQEANRLRKAASATKIQACWRSRSAQLHFVHDLADIIRVQSIARVFFARCTAAQLGMEKMEQNAAATSIQAAWKGFWGFSHYVILQFEVTKVQAFVRGMNARKNQQFQLGCCILIQAAARRYLVRKGWDNFIMERAFTESKAIELRERLSAERIQFWWSVVLECRKEKAAALTIEKFFIMVKEEVEKEILRQEKRKQDKRAKRRRKKHDKDDKVLERVWLNTVDDGNVDAIAYSASQSTMGTPMSHASSSFSSGNTPRKASSTKNSKYPATRNSKTVMSPNVRHRSTSPSMDMVMRHEYAGSGARNDLVITDTKNIPSSGGGSGSKKPKPIMTAVTHQPSPMTSSGIHSLAFSKSEYSEDSPSSSEAPSKVGLSSPVFNTRGSPSKPDKVNKYMNMYGLRSGSARSNAPSSASQKSSHFFADEDTTEDSFHDPHLRHRVPTAPTHKHKTGSPSAAGESQASSAIPGSAAPTTSTGLVKGLNVTTDHPSQYQKALLAAAKATISSRSNNSPAGPHNTPASPSPRHGKMTVMHRYQRSKPSTPSQASGSDESSFLAGEEFGMI